MSKQRKKSETTKEVDSTRREGKFKALMAECQRRINDNKGPEANDSQVEIILAAAALVCLKKHGHELPDEIEEIIQLERALTLPKIIAYSQSTDTNLQLLAHAAKAEKDTQKN